MMPLVRRSLAAMIAALLAGVFAVVGTPVPAGSRSQGLPAHRVHCGSGRPAEQPAGGGTDHLTSSRTDRSTWWWKSATPPEVAGNS